jgi:pilus assembly protein CpaB
MKNIKWFGTQAFTAVGTLVVVLCASRWIPAHSVGSTKIAVAAVDIDVGQRLAPRLIKLIDWPIGTMPPGAFSDPDKLDGRVASASMIRGEPLTERDLQPLTTAAVSRHRADAAVLAATHGDDSDAIAWLSLLGEPWGPVASKPS